MGEEKEEEEKEEQEAMAMGGADRPSQRAGLSVYGCLQPLHPS